MTVSIIADQHIPLLPEIFDTDVTLELIAPQDFTAKRVQNADAIIIRTRTHVNETLLQNTRLRIVASATSGIDHIEAPLLQQLRIDCIDAKGSNAPAVRQYIVAVLALLRQNQLLTSTQTRIGIIGVGYVGQAVNDALTQLGFTVLLCDPIRRDNEISFPHTDIHKLQDCDILSLHTPLTLTGPYPTQYLITEDILKAQKQDCVIINTARGEVIDPRVIKDTQANSKQPRFVFDVYPNEPNIDPHYLDIALLTTPHIAGYSVESKIRASLMVGEKICDYFNLSKRCLREIAWPQAKFELPKRDWETAALAGYNPSIDHLALQNIKKYPPNELAKAFHELREKRALRSEMS